MTLDDPENRIDPRGVAGDQFDADTCRPARFGDDLGCESIIADRHIDQVGSHAAIIHLPLGPNPTRRVHFRLGQRAGMSPEEESRRSMSQTLGGGSGCGTLIHPEKRADVR